MQLTADEWLTLLTRRHTQLLPDLKALDRYYEGQQPLSYMHPQLIAEIGDMVRQVVINWPRLVVDSLEERLDVEGFRFAVPGAGGGEDDADEETANELWRIWQANNLDEGSQQAHVDALVMRRSFLIVGSNADDPLTPLITVESPLQMEVDYDPATRKVRAAMKRWYEVDPVTGAIRDEKATIYLPDQTVHYAKTVPNGWTVQSEDAHKLGEVPVVPLVNRGRLLTPGGVSELADIIPLSDAACKIATDMMISAEFHAMPRRYALGFDQEDFTDADGNPVSTWQTLAGRVWATAKNIKDDGVSVGQFPEADLGNFHSTLNQLARLVASLSGMPPHYLGMATDNPPSADAIRSSEIRLIKRAERRQRAWGGSYEQVMRLALRIRDGVWDPRARSLETRWGDPATPTFAQKADAVTKLKVAGILPREATWDALNYTMVQQERLRQQFQAEADSALGSEFSALLGAQRQPAAAPPVVPEQPPASLLS
jgi:hypothetical protein